MNYAWLTSLKTLSENQRGISKWRDRGTSRRPVGPELMSEFSSPAGYSLRGIRKKQKFDISAVKPLLLACSVDTVEHPHCDDRFSLTIFGFSLLATAKAFSKLRIAEF